MESNIPRIKKVAILLALIIFCNFAICLTLLYMVKQINLEENGEIVLSGDYGVYAINSQNILQDLSQGNKDVFQYLNNGELIVTPKANLPPVHWTEADYLLIANEFNQLVSNESLVNWEYHSISYSMNCSDFSYGPQQAIYEIVKYVSLDDKEVRVEREIWIYPHQNRVEWDETQYYAEYSYASFTLDQVNISLEDALRIAEEQGGERFRLSENNQCRIVQKIIAGNQNSNWQIRYTSNDRQYIIYVDKNTGGYQISNP